MTLLFAILVAVDTLNYRVLNHGRPAGDLVVLRDGASLTTRYVYTDRNRGQRLETRYGLRANGAPQRIEVRPIGADGVVGEATVRFESTADSVRWSFGQAWRGERLDSAAYFLPPLRTPFDAALLARYLLRQPGHTARLLPSGTARLTVIADTTVLTARGREPVRMVAIEAGFGPVVVWLDRDDALFASEAGWFITVRPGAEAALPVLRAAELRYHHGREAEVARRLHQPLPRALVLRNGTLFDSERGAVRPGTTVVVRGERVVAVGPTDSISVPSDATVIDATGKTVMPGMWEMHGHFILGASTSGSLTQLANGITTVRDLAADIDIATSYRDRAAAGTVVAPRAVLGGFIEGPGKWAGPSEVIVRTEEEARAWVARYDALGYKQVKLYNLVHPDLVPSIVQEAKARGLRVSGHIPRGLSIPAAIKLGYQEINHAAFLFSNFFPDSLFVPTMRPYSAVAAMVAPNFKVEGTEMSALIDLMRQHGTVLDGTFSIWAGPNPQPNNAYLRLAKRLFDAGVPLVPGTDSPSGTNYVNELLFYERAGIPARNVLQMATIGAARVMRDERDYGSIAPGKVADILIVNGNPAESIVELRKLETVIRAGRSYSVAGLLGSAR